MWSCINNYVDGVISYCRSGCPDATQVVDFFYNVISECSAGV